MYFAPLMDTVNGVGIQTLVNIFSTQTIPWGHLKLQVQNFKGTVSKPVVTYLGPLDFSAFLPFLQFRYGGVGRYSLW